MAAIFAVLVVTLVGFVSKTALAQGPYVVYARGIDDLRPNGPGYTRLIPVAAPVSPRRLGEPHQKLSRKDDSALPTLQVAASQSAPSPDYWPQEPAPVQQRRYYEAAPSQDVQQSGTDPMDPDGDVIVGVAGRDYPVLAAVPQTGFECSRYPHPGYYADQEALCQVFHICQADGRRDSFLCPNGTIFNQHYFVCEWWYNVNCQESHNYFDLNALIGVAPAPSPSQPQQQYRQPYPPPAASGYDRPVAPQPSRYSPPATPPSAPEYSAYASSPVPSYRKPPTSTPKSAPPSAVKTKSKKPASNGHSQKNYSELEFPQSVYSQLSSPPFT